MNAPWPRKKKLNQAYAAEDRKLRNAQKIMDIVQAQVNTHVAATAAYKAGPFLGPIMAIVIEALGLAQVAAIAAKKYATGGQFKGKGTGTSDSNLAWISDEEYIVNAKSTKENLALLDWINNGGKLPMYANGTTTQSQSAPVSFVNKTGVLTELTGDTLQRILNELIVIREKTMSVPQINELLKSIRPEDFEKVFRPNFQRLLEAIKQIRNSQPMFALGKLQWKDLWPFEEGGKISGAAHSNGGVLINAEGGEYIVNKNSTSKYLSLLEMINNGKGLPAYAMGGMVKLPQMPTVSVNYGSFGRNEQNGAAIEATLKAINESVQILNINLVKKEMSPLVINNSNSEATVKAVDKSRRELTQRGYNADLQRY